VSTTFSRRELLVRGTGLVLGTMALPRFLGALELNTAMLVYKDPGCACCEKWILPMQPADFVVAVSDTPDMNPIKRRYKVPAALASCHTALVGGYVIEGHVPADLIKKLLREKPKVLGLTVPGMVTGSPGMEGATKDPYRVLTFDAAGKTTVYAQR
jgi:hypothetical protein